jgi:hypothetical protein
MWSIAVSYKRIASCCYQPAKEKRYSAYNTTIQDMYKNDGETDWKLLVLEMCVAKFTKPIGDINLSQITELTSYYINNEVY